jgi:DNA polymerase-1
MKAWVAANSDVEIMDKQRVVYPEREESALEAVRTQLWSIEKAVREQYRIREFTDISVILSGPGNYRNALAKRFPYKGNRDADHKPYWYQSIRDYLTGSWGARVVSGREADDECSIIAWSYLNAEHECTTDASVDANGWVRLRALPAGAYCVATIDKDLDQIPGLHYNYLKSVHYDQTPDAAELFFWQQCLSGDATDGIPGCYRIGEARAKRIISESAGLSYWDSVVAEYAESTKRKGCPYLVSDAAAVALETARLVYLQQVEGELWNPPPEPHGRLPGYEDE